MARPTLPVGKVRNVRIVVWVTPNERAAVASQAKACGLAVSTYVRLLLKSGVTGV